MPCMKQGQRFEVVLVHFDDWIVAALERLIKRGYRAIMG